MGQLLLKLNYICSAITSLFLDNGKGRVTPVNETVGPGDPSGFSVFISQMLTAIGNALLSIGEFLLSCIARLVYFAAKIAMNIMDFMNIIVKQLSGQATNYSNLSSNASLEETDILFQFLFNEVTLRILRNVFIFALVLLIIFSIIAIVKQEWENHINGKQNSVKKIFRKIIISVFSLIIVPFVVILDSIADPHNLGAIIRTAESAGVHGIILQKDRACPVNETVYKTSAGAISNMLIARVVNISQEIEFLKKQGLWIYGLELGGVDFYKTNLTGPIAIVIGSEGEGIRALVKKNCDNVLTLPMKGQVNSLNASVAGGVAIYEILRQRI